jgi:hypothetical protein
MKKITFLIAFILVSVFCQAQDYKPFNLKGESLFMNANYDVQAIRIDSVKASGTDTIYKNYLSAVPCVANYNGYCIGSWIGSKVIKKNNGWCYFFNGIGDTVKFNPRAALNTKWTLFTYPNKSSLQANVSSINYINLASFKDSVKTISVYQVDSLGNQGALHSEFKISKTNGFVKLYNIYDYPGHPQAYELANALNSGLNIKNIQAKEVYDFAVGDEFDTHEYYYNSGPGYNNYDYLTKKIVLKKTISLNGDSLTYTDSIYSKHTNGGYPGTVSTTYRNAIIQEVFLLNDKYLNTLPSALIPNSNGFYIPSLQYLTTSMRMRKIVLAPYHLQSGFFPYRDQDNCFYLEGAGGCYFGPRINDACGALCTTETGNILLYYKKGSITYGTPISRSVLTFVQEFKASQLDVSISPNPINNSAFLEIKNKPSNEVYIFSLSDLLGNEVFHKEFTADKIEIERGALAPGLYVYSLKSQTQAVKMGKVVIQ